MISRISEKVSCATAFVEYAGMFETGTPISFAYSQSTMLYPVESNAIYLRFGSYLRRGNQKHKNRTLTTVRVLNFIFKFVAQSVG